MNVIKQINGSITQEEEGAKSVFPELKYTDANGQKFNNLGGGGNYQQLNNYNIIENAGKGGYLKLEKYID